MDTRAGSLILALAFIGFGTPGCGDDTDGTGGTGAEGGQPSTGGSGGEAPTCEDLGGQCLNVPAGFKGPIELHDDGIATCTNPAFEGGYDDGDFMAPDAVCECSCISDDTPCTATATVYDDVACATKNTAAVDLTDPGCHETPAGTTWLGVTIAIVGATSCSSDVALATKPAIEFDPKVDGCNVNLDLCTTGGTCFPDSVKTYCVYSTTENECPAGFDDMHRVLQEADLEDTRDCNCDCAGATVTCDPAATLYSDAACADDLAEAAGACIAGANGEAIGAIQIDNPFSATCEGAAETLSGGVTISGAGVLVCCLAG